MNSLETMRCVTPDQPIIMDEPPPITRNKHPRNTQIVDGHVKRCLLLEDQKRLCNLILQQLGFKDANDRETNIVRKDFKKAAPLIKELASELTLAYGENHRIAKTCKSHELKVSHVLTIVREMLREQDQYILYRRRSIKEDKRYKTSYYYRLIGSTDS